MSGGLFVLEGVSASRGGKCVLEGLDLRYPEADEDLSGVTVV